MKNIMQLLFDHILDRTYEFYLPHTKYMAYHMQQMAAERRLLEQLTPDQQSLFEEYQECRSNSDLETLYATFLASFDLGISLSSRPFP